MSLSSEMSFQFSLHLELKGKEQIQIVTLDQQHTPPKNSSMFFKISGQNDFVVFAGICWP